MNKSALKTFATNARKELLERVELQARKIGITEDDIKKATVESSDAIFIDDRQLSDVERKQRDKLIARIEEIGFQQVMEETAYTWFNRFVALRYMEVNDYLPTKVRVLSSETKASTTPDMIEEALSLDLDIDKEYIYELKMANKMDELFKYLIKLHCNDLNRYMPFMFESIEDYMLILFPEGLLGPDSFVREMTDTDVIPEENWQEIEIIGWLYQFYIADEKDRVFQQRRKYKSEEIPYATQLFTPKWIVRYMVQNSLGRYWVEAHPEDKGLLHKWEFYLEHDDDFQDKIAPYVNRELNVEEIKCLDPAMGSGHILVYMFDVLYEIYSKCGYMEREIPRLIIENNLYGLDIDDRAYQLACFSVVMKALEYNRRFLRSIEREGLRLNLAAIQETNKLTVDDIAYIAGEEKGEKFDEVERFIKQFNDAKSVGSLIKLDSKDTKYVQERFQVIASDTVDDLFELEKRERVLSIHPKLIKQTEVMGKQYDILVMNPPYMGSGGMNQQLSSYVRKHYPDSRADLFATFMEVDQYVKENGFYAAINQHSWMFLSSFNKLREKVLKNKFIDTMLHLGPRAFEEIGGEVVQSTAFVMRNSAVEETEGIYVRLIDERTAAEKRSKTLEAVQAPTVPYRYSFNQENFSKIPGSPIAYWLKNVSVFNNKKIRELFYSGGRNKTHNNQKYTRYFWEVSLLSEKWVSYLNGGEYKKYYGNNIYVVNWSEDAKKFYASRGGLLNPNYLNKLGLTWNLITSGNPGFKIKQESFVYSSGSPTILNDSQKDIYHCLGFLNSKVANYLLKILNPTLNTTVGDVLSLPIIIKKQFQVEKKVRLNISSSKTDWDSFETSWDFTKHPLLKFPSNTIESSFNEWERFAEKQFYQLKENEEELNRIFIDIYGLQDELTPDVADEDVTVRKAELERDIKSFISYVVGCAFGRYSLDEEGLIYAGGEFDETRYKTFPADEDNVIPILPGAYFEDDIVTRFVHFVETTYGADTLEENLDFIANAIGRRKNETAREALRRYFLNDFYKDHVRIYKKRPIYWLFTSGREKAFNCLIYMHRYDQTTLSRIRTDYLHNVQTRYETEKRDLLAIIEGEGTAKEIHDAKKELTAVEKKIDELKKYDEKLHHMADMQIEIDLDDGVKVNHEKFKRLVARI